ncbi:hypothetical protein ACLKMY_32920, partial [Paraburkholderia mimosarum]|uniref:hypothetical protein n=1 Tax=Paraburkholderia mimosarum TaxID=312026 RepID=UPI0039C0A5BD
MAGESNVVEELIVKISLDSRDYARADKEIEQRTKKTAKVQDEAGAKEKKRDEEAKKRAAARTKQAKEFAGTLQGVATAGLALAGLTGGLAGVVAMVQNLAAGENGLNRLRIATGLARQELAAWGGTSKALGVDAAEGQQAVAKLATELKNGRLTGNMQNISALSYIGVTAKEDEKPEDYLARVQQKYRSYKPAQQEHIQGLLAGQVDPAILQMIMSNKDIGAVYSDQAAKAASVD